MGAVTFGRLSLGQDKSCVTCPGLWAERFGKVSFTAIEFTFSPSTDQTQPRPCQLQPVYTDALTEYRAAMHRISQFRPLYSIFRMIIYIVQRRLPRFKCCVYFTDESPDSFVSLNRSITSSTCEAVNPYFTGA